MITLVARRPLVPTIATIVRTTNGNWTPGTRTEENEIITQHLNHYNSEDKRPVGWNRRARNAIYEYQYLMLALLILLTYSYLSLL